MSRRFIIIGSIVVVLLGMSVFVLWNLCLREVPLRIAERTTYITEPLTEDGKRVDYFRYLDEREPYPPEMRTDANGYRILVRHIAKFPYSETHHRLMGNKLGLDGPDDASLTLQDPYTFLYRRFPDSFEKSQEVSGRIRQPWTLEDVPVMKDWLDKTVPLVELLDEAARKPEWMIPFVRGDDSHDLFAVMLHGCLDFRAFSNVLDIHAHYRIGKGDREGAVNDAMTCFLLARRISRRSAATGYYIGLAMEDGVLRVPLGRTADEIEPELITRFLAEIDTLPPRATLAEMREWQRYETLDMLQRDPTHERKNRSVDFGDWRNKYSLNWNIPLAMINRTFDELIADRPVTKIDSSVAWFDNLTVRARSFQCAAKLVDAIADGSTGHAAIKATNRCDCKWNLKRLALALLLYEKEHGALPDENWCAAIRPLLGENPEHFFHCPEHAATPGETSYALVRSGPLLLVELAAPVACDQATVPPLGAADAGSSHFNVFCVAHRNGAVESIVENGELRIESEE